MSEKCAVVGYIYGEVYQSLSPLYAYSVLRAYPEYSVLLYFDRAVGPSVRKQLESLQSFGDVRFKENYRFRVPQTGASANAGNVLRAGRWLLNDVWFDEFKWLYIGDIDIFILPEELPLAEAHQAHMSRIGLPYSNVVRLTADARALTPGALRVLWRSRDYLTLRKRIAGKVIARNRLTGLHFVEREPYYRSVAPLFGEFQEELLRDTPEVRARDDEELLYDLVKRSGLGLPEISATGPDLDPRNASLLNFRPHHGIHLGIFRTRGSIDRQRQVIGSVTYRKYYELYREARAEPEFRMLLSDPSCYASRLLRELEAFLDHHQSRA